MPVRITSGQKSARIQAGQSLTSRHPCCNEVNVGDVPVLMPSQVYIAKILADLADLVDFITGPVHS
eukprot:CAMPEP_0204163958 /NCGR_PEP_ID=MMETSP0361-20130328/36853_1 /ASSEMBLY_ACC=CAM_ASM_000343 /TAXON_ID=268821 /ORGANISM="Scrippsiella Hangoei, Strain SHTV-5" /LENGTH=65 /DNA_ID=CAMNT_0051120737 /DNA_START=89 /DNA_END=283 /DNA_ORIENTATION=-